MDDNSKKVDDTEVLDLLRRSRRALRDSDNNNDVENDDMEMEEEEEEEEEEEGKDNDNEEGEDMNSDDSDFLNESERPEFELEAELAKEYEDEAQAKRKYELLYKNKKSPTSKQDSALMKLRNARRRKVKGMKLSSSSDEYDGEGDEGSDSDEYGDEDDEYSEGYGSKHRVSRKKSRPKRKEKYSEADSDESFEDGDIVERKGLKRTKKTPSSSIRETSLFDDDNHSQEKLMRKCDKVLESISLKLMRSVHLTRDRIEFMLEHPRFTEYISGSYVKVPIINPSTNSEIFLTCEVFDAQIIDENKCVFTLQRGGSKKEWGIESISNNVLTNDDLLEWKAMVREFYSSDSDYILSLPRVLQKKAIELNGFQYGDDDIALILERKQKTNANSLSGKILIETRTNLQTQIKQLEMQLKNTGLDNTVRKSKLAKIDQLQQELEQTISQIEKLKLHKEMIHPDKSLRITSSRYIGGVQGKGSGTTSMYDDRFSSNVNSREAVASSQTATNRAYDSLYKLIFGPVSPRNQFQGKTEYESPTARHDQNCSQSRSLHASSSLGLEPNFGRRECRPSVMWETKRNKPGARQAANGKPEGQEVQQALAGQPLEQNPKPFEYVVQDIETNSNLVLGMEQVISEFKEFCSNVDLSHIASSRNSIALAACLPPVSSFWNPLEIAPKSKDNVDLSSKFQELIKSAIKS